MTAEELLATLSARGLCVEAVGDRIRVGPADRLTDRDREAIRSHKAALLGALTPCAPEVAGGDGGHGRHAGPPAAPDPPPDRLYFTLGPDGRATLRPAGTRFPPGTLYWCYPGATRWTPCGS